MARRNNVGLGGYAGAVKCFCGFHCWTTVMNGFLKTKKVCIRCGTADGSYKDGFDRMKEEVRKRHKKWYKIW